LFAEKFVFVYIFTGMGVEREINEEQLSAEDVLNLNRVLLVDDNPIN